MLAHSPLLILLTFLPISFALVSLPPPPARHLTQPRSSITRPHHAARGSELRDLHTSWVPRKRRTAKGRGSVQVGGVDLALHGRTTSGLRKRINGTMVPLGDTLDTFVVPVSIGNPGVTYPLQLDIASSDLLLASTLCGSACPASGGTTVNPYYDVSRGSSSFHTVNSNGTRWAASFGDGTVASGFLALENVTLGTANVPQQVFGMMNATNLTLSQQQVSGILGLGFPRLSILSRALLPANSTTTTSSSSSSASASSAPTYFPPLLESLVTTPRIPYPVFALALSPPPANTTATATTSSSAASASATRYSTRIGSLTLGGVSSLYVGNATGWGVGDIEWWDVVPFGPALVANSSTASPTGSASSASSGNASPTMADVVSGSSVSGSASVFSSSSASASASSSLAGSRRDFPASVAQLDSEEYLYWALELANVSMNGTDVGLTSSYASIGLPSVALLDIGNNGIYGPQQDVERLFSLVTDAREVSTGQWAVPCNADMNMGFSFGGRYVQLQPSDWMYAAVAGTSFCLAWPVAVEDPGTGIDWTLGTPFLKNVYSVYSYGINGVQAPLVGFLPITAMSNTTNTSSLYNPTPTHVVPASLTATVGTTLPNALLPDPTFATPSYGFSSRPALGALQLEGLANASAYSISGVPIISTPTSMPYNLSGSSDVSSKSTGSNTANTSDASPFLTRVPSLFSLAFTFMFMSIPFLIA